MNMKKAGTLALALALTATVSAPAALAATEPVPANTQVTTTKPNAAAYKGTIIVNGETLDTSALPASQLLPVRAIVEADHGFGSWYDSEPDQGVFYAGKDSLAITFSTLEVKHGEEVLAQAKVELKDGVTFMDSATIGKLADYTITYDEKTDTTTVVTPNNDPMMKLCYNIIETTEMGRGMQSNPQEMKDGFEIRPENFSTFVAFIPMVINADSLIIGKVSGKMDEAKADLKGYQERMIRNFETYLPGPLELAKNGKIVEKDGYLMLVISPDTAKATELFEAFVAEQNKGGK